MKRLSNPLDAKKKYIASLMGYKKFTEKNVPAQAEVHPTDNDVPAQAEIHPTDSSVTGSIVRVKKNRPKVRVKKNRPKVRVKKIRPVIRATKKRRIEAHPTYPPLESPVSPPLESPVSLVLDDSHLEKSVTPEDDFFEIIKLLEHAYQNLEGNGGKSTLDRENDPKPQRKHHRKYY